MSKLFILVVILFLSSVLAGEIFTVKISIPPTYLSSKMKGRVSIPSTYEIVYKTIYLRGNYSHVSKLSVDVDKSRNINYATGKTDIAICIPEKETTLTQINETCEIRCLDGRNYINPKKEYLEVFNKCFKTNITEMNDIYMYYGRTNGSILNIYRPITKIFNAVDFEDMEDILHFLVDKLEEISPGSVLIEDNMETEDSEESINMKFKNKKIMKDTTVKMLPTFISINTYNKRSEFRSFNYSKNKKEGSKLITYHAAKINITNAGYNNYKFKSICCKYEPMDFLLDTYGIAINGAFFNTKSYKPMGKYKQTKNVPYYARSINTYSELSKNYSDVYGYVVIIEGRLTLHKEYKITGKEDSVFMAGPFLIDNGKAMITENDINDKGYMYGKYFVKKYKCQDAFDKLNRTVLTNTNEIVSTCNTITPGELSHGANLNPRTMLIETKDNIIFVVVDGIRNEDFPESINDAGREGADFIDLVEIALDLGAIRAINLDGGSSSAMAWSFEKDVIWSSSRTQDYPVGNILVLANRY